MERVGAWVVGGWLFVFVDAMVMISNDDKMSALDSAFFLWGYVK